MKIGKKSICLATIFAIIMTIFIPSIVRADGESRVQVILQESYMGSYTFQAEGLEDATEYTTSKNKMIDIGKDVTVVATPNADFSFVGWYNCEEFPINEHVMGWRTTGDALTTNTTYTFNASEQFHNIMPVFRSNGGHNNIWATAGGEIAVYYAGSDNVNLDGEHWAERGIIVDYRNGDQITVKARANEGYRFIGWFISDPAASVAENYVRDPMISDENEYTYTPGVTTIDGVDEPINYITAAFEEDNVEQEEYVISTEDGSMTAIFTFDQGHEFFLNVFEIMGMSAEEIENITGVPASEVERIKKIIIENVKKYGDVIAVYGITIDEPDIMSYSDALKLKIKLTEAMKKYDTLKFIYIDDENNFVVQDVKDVLLAAEYGEVNLDHLSAYALVGSKTEESTVEESELESNSVKAGDMFSIWFSAVVVSIAGIGVLIRKKK